MQLLRISQVRELQEQVSRLEEKLARLQRSSAAARAAPCLRCAPAGTINSGAVWQDKAVAAAQSCVPQPPEREASRSALGQKEPSAALGQKGQSDIGMAGDPRVVLSSGGGDSSNRKRGARRVLTLKANRMVRMVDGLADVRERMVSFGCSTCLGFRV